MKSDKLKYRSAIAQDAKAIMELIMELAHYEKASDQVSLSQEQLMADGFGPSPRFNVDVAELENKIVGMALSYDRYSTWQGKSLYLEDLVVTQSARRMGVGNTLFDRVLKRAHDGGYSRLEWQVLDWNNPAIQFYESKNWEKDESWINGRIRIV